MGLNNAMNSGISGLQSFSNSMSVIGNNLANTNTTGFKAGRTLFSDLIPNNVSGSGGISQIGSGTTLSTVDNIFSQGSLESTSSATDLAIEGPGFFVVRYPNSQNNHYTRAGAFYLDNNGFLVNPEGYIVQGFERNEGAGYADFTSDIQIDNRSFVQAEATSKVDLTTNLNSQAEIIEGGWDIDDPSGTSNFSTTTLVYDSLGETHLITVYFTKTGVNEWEYNVTVPLDPDDPMVVAVEGTFTFDENGILTEIDGVDEENHPNWPAIKTIEGELAWNNGSNPDNVIEFTMNLTQFATESRVMTQEANGCASGSLTSIAVDIDGVITGIYSNGQTKDLAKLALAKFSNDNGLSKVGKNLFEATGDSGPPMVGTPGSGVGKIFSYALEKSTVDIAAEFAKMIITQRSFQAVSKTITTTDEMLNEVINLKR
jgi:flagellar hook protein FlgE